MARRQSGRNRRRRITDLQTRGGRRRQCEKRRRRAGEGKEGGDEIDERRLLLPRSRGRCRGTRRRREAEQDAPSVGYADGSPASGGAEEGRRRQQGAAQ